MTLLLSALAVAIMVGIAWAMGFRSRPTLDEAAARDEAEGRIAGFRAAQVALAQGGRGAVLRGADGSLVLVLPFGDSWLCRLVPPGQVHLRQGVLQADLGETMLGKVQLPLEQPPGWLQEVVA